MDSLLNSAPAQAEMAIGCNHDIEELQEVFGNMEGASPYYGYSFKLEGGRPYFQMKGASGTAIGYSNKVLSTKWMHITAAVDPSTGIVSMYTNGQDGTATDASAATGNPTYDLLTNGIGKSLQSILKATRSDYSFSKTDMNRMMRLLPFQNMYGINNIINFLKEKSGLPEKGSSSGL